MANVKKFFVLVCSTAQEASNERAYLEQLLGLADADVSVDMAISFVYKGDHSANPDQYANAYVVYARVP